MTENDHKRATVELEEAHIAMAMATATMFQALLSALMREKAISLQTIDDRILGVIEKIYDVPPELNIAKVYRMEAAAGMAMATKIRSDLLSD